MKLLNKLKNIFKLNFKTIWFNFHYLPFKQAIKFPILLYNARLIKMGGTVKIEAPDIRFGMIKMGEWRVTLYGKRDRFNWEHRGTCIFRGKVIIGNGSSVSTGRNGVLDIEPNLVVSYGMKLACYKRIKIGENCRIGWENIIIDTDFHETVNRSTGERSEMSKDVVIGKNNWVGTRAMLLKGTQTPDFCIIGSQSLLNKKFEVEPFCLIAGTPAKLKVKDIYRDLESNVTKE